MVRRMRVQYVVRLSGAIGLGEPCLGADEVVGLGEDVSE
jgi:hypothetical protein